MSYIAQILTTLKNKQNFRYFKDFLCIPNIPVAETGMDRGRTGN